MISKNLMKVLGLILALTFVAAACSSDDGEETEAGDDTTESTEAEAEAEEPAEDEEDAMEEEEEEATEGEEAAPAGDCAEGTVNISGSSTVEPIAIKAAELFEEPCPDVIVNVDGPGTGDGFALFCAGDTDVSDASRAIKDSEKEECEANGINFVELKLAFDGIAVMTSPANETVECVSFADMYALMGAEADGAVENWSDAAAVAGELGSTTEFPDAPLDIGAPGTESGTYDSFIEIVLEGIAEERGQEDFIRQDFTGNPDDSVIIQTITGSDSSFGWVGFAFAEANKDSVKVLGVSEEPGGDCITPSIESIADGSYPVSRALFQYVNVDKAAENPAICQYMNFWVGDEAVYTDAVANAFGEGQGYIPTEDLRGPAADALGTACA